VTSDRGTGHKNSHNGVLRHRHGAWIETRNSVILKPLASHAPLAQLDRASGYEPEGREFESLRARHFPPVFTRPPEILKFFVSWLARVDFTAVLPLADQEQEARLPETSSFATFMQN
jgi:hypothetical protein